MSEDLTDEEMADQRRRAAREKQRWLEAYEEIHEKARIAQYMADSSELEQRDQ